METLTTAMTHEDLINALNCNTFEVEKRLDDHTKAIIELQSRVTDCYNWMLKTTPRIEKIEVDLGEVKSDIKLILAELKKR